MKKKLKKLSPVFSALIFILFISMGFQQTAKDPIVFNTEQIIEAESGTLTGPIQKFAGSDAAGGYYLMNHYTTSKKLSDPDLQTLPDLSYKINVPEDGDYFLWLRVKVPGTLTIFAKYLSAYIGGDNTNYHACVFMANTGWEWQRAINIRMKKGIRTIDLKHKDFHLGVDQLFVTSTGSDLSKLGQSPSPENILKANYNVQEPVNYPPLTVNDGLGLDIPKPPAEHPRLFFRRQDIPSLKEKINDPLMKTAWDKILAASKYPHTGLLDAPVDGLANYNMEIINSIEARALIYAFYKDKTSGRNAIDAILNFFNTVKYNPSTGDISRFYGRFMLAGAIVYDWCYDLLTADEKTALIGWADTMAGRMEIGWPVIKQGAVTGHGSEFQLMRDILSAGIAMYDEKKDIYMLAAGRFFKNYVPARTFFYPAGYHHQGSSYGGYRYMTELYATALFDRMGFPKIFGEDQKKVPWFAIYTRRPDGQIMRDGDDYTSRGKEVYWSRNGASDILSASFFKDPVVMGEARREIKEFGNSGDYLFDFLLIDTSVKPEPLDNQPLTKFFPSPLGAMVARTGWESGKNSSTVVATMRIGEYYFANHQHLDAGHFQVYYKGALASEGGYYDAYGTDHDYNYNKRTIAHNSLLVYDPEEQIRRNVVNDGGQRFPNGGSEPANIDIMLTRGYKIGEILARHFGPDSIKPEYTYLKGDLTQAYTGKIKQFQRSFVFLNLESKEHPAALIVFDRLTSSNQDFRKTWLLHSIEEPFIDGINTTITRSRKDYNGKMVNTTLFPASDNLLIKKIGGPGHEFDVMGTNHPAINLPDPTTTSDESGSWRIEVSPKKPSTNDIFLNIMQVMDNDGGPEPLTALKLSTDQLVGTKIAGRVVLFSKTGEKLDDKVNFMLDGEGTLKVLVTDLKQGFWKVEKTGEKAKVQYQVGNDAGVLYFSGVAGKYTLTRSDSKTPGIPPAFPAQGFR